MLLQLVALNCQCDVPGVLKRREVYIIGLGVTGLQLTPCRSCLSKIVSDVK